MACQCVSCACERVSCCAVLSCVVFLQSTEHAPNPPSCHCTHDDGAVHVCVVDGLVLVHSESADTTPFESTHCTVTVSMPEHEHVVGFDVTHE